MSQPVALLLPKEYGYVILATSSTFFLGFWHGLRCSSFRRPAKMPYPKAYADSIELSTDDAELKKARYLFNCAQRAHANYLENVSFVNFAALIAGVRFPVTTAGLLVTWMAGRLVYALGYTRADKSKGEGRLAGSFFWLSQLALFGTAAWSGAMMLM